METLIIIGFVVVFIVLFCFFSDLYSGKKEEERKRIAAEKQWEEENKRLAEIREKLCKNPVFHDIMEKIHLEFDEILAKASVTPILKGNRHYYSINIFSYAVKTGERLGTGLLSVCPNKSKFYFSSYNMDEMPRDYVIALANEISADFYNRYKDKFPETPLFAKIETPFQNSDGEIDDDEGVFFIKIDLTQLHPKYNAW